MIFVKGAPFVACIVAGCLAVGGVTYAAVTALSNIKTEAQDSVVSRIESYGTDYEERLMNNEKVKSYNDDVTYQNTVNQHLNDYKNSPDAKNKADTDSKPYFMRDDDGIWIYDLTDDVILSDVAKISGMTKDEIAKYNNVDSVDVLYQKGVLRLPKDSISDGNLRNAGVLRIGTKNVVIAEHG